VISRALFELQYLLGSPRWDTGISPPELIAHLDQHHAGRAIDLGCGTGTNLITIASRGWDVMGIDVSYLAIRQARQKTKAAGVSVNLQRGDVSRLEGITGPFDLALDIGCFHNLDEDKRVEYKNSISRVVHPGGSYLLYSWLTNTENGIPAEDKILKTFSLDFDLTATKHGTDGSRQSAYFTFTRKSA
jgi:cyclopropane fatty-acyl-phospholipid synthase-like methyltransferase